MNTAPRVLITVTLVAVVVAGIYKTRRVSGLRDQVQTLEQQQVPLTERIGLLSRERDDATGQMAALRQENERLRQTEREVSRLRGEVTRLQSLERLAQSKIMAPDTSDPFSQSVLALTARARELYQHLEQLPETKIPELQFLTEHQWLDAARDAELQSDAGVRKALSKLRSLAKQSFAPRISSALDAYLAANQGQLPTELLQLQPYFKAPVDESILQRYELLRTGNVKDLPNGTWVVSEKRPVDRDYDSHLYIAPNGRTGSWGTGLHSSGDPDPNWINRE
jgi:hypothetical protein